MAFILELEAKNVEQAIQLACEKLEIPRDELKYDVISHGSSGIFGLGKSKKAKIRVLLPEEGDDSRQPEFDAAETGEKSPEIRTHVQDLIQENLEPNDETDSPTTEDQTVLGSAVLQRIVDAITTDARVTTEQGSDKIRFNVEGGNSAVLIGRHGQTLEAMQSIVEKVINKNNTKRIRVQVDVEGYMENRKNQLIRHAERMAQKCKLIRRPVTVGNMNAHDRRIVHLALRGDHKVRTHSTGEGYIRKLVIFPRKSADNKRRSS
jgi:spoIIIJ-associated protein